MLPPEIEEGNKEYKRFFKDIKKHRFIELSTQMNWRLNEGNGIAYYYIGVNDDGTIHNKLSSKQIKYSMNTLKKLANHNKATITKNEKNTVDKNIWFKVEIKRMDKVVKYKEYRILLLGDTNTGKSTFLANLIKNKLDVNGDAKNYTINHKHELVSGDTSSINYYSLIDKENNYLFFDTPGNPKYIKTLLKIVQSINFNLVLYFPHLNDNINWEYEYLFFRYFYNFNIHITTINLKADNNNYPNINMNKIIKKELFVNNILNKLDNFTIINSKVHFTILNTFYSSELGFLLSGYLKSGTIIENQTLFWYTNQKIKVQVISIHDSVSSKDTVAGPCTITLRVKIKNPEDALKNIKYGFITNINNYYVEDKIKITWEKDLYLNKNEHLICNCNNLKIILKLQNNYYYSVNNFTFWSFLENQRIVCSNKKIIGVINFI